MTPAAFATPAWSTGNFSIYEFDAAECKRLRLTHQLNPSDMAEIAGLPGRWAWMSIEAGYEPIHPGCWVICLLALGEYPEIRDAAIRGTESRQV